jgi:hypothetical protein
MRFGQVLRNELGDNWVGRGLEFFAGMKWRRETRKDLPERTSRWQRRRRSENLPQAAATGGWLVVRRSLRVIVLTGPRG